MTHPFARFSEFKGVLATVDLDQHITAAYERLIALGWDRSEAKAYNLLIPLTEAPAKPRVRTTSLGIKVAEPDWFAYNPKSLSGAFGCAQFLGTTWNWLCGFDSSLTKTKAVKPAEIKRELLALRDVLREQDAFIAGTPFHPITAGRAASLHTHLQLQAYIKEGGARVRITPEFVYGLHYLGGAGLARACKLKAKTGGNLGKAPSGNAQSFHNAVVGAALVNV